MQRELLNEEGAPVQLQEWGAGAHRIGVAHLNSEKTLNALSQAMIDVLAPQLRRWAADPRIVVLWISGAGERAFAAGGDIQALYASVTRNHAAGALIDGAAEKFFETEYRLDYALHRYPKPIVAWGQGVIMGGGLGIFAAASHRIVSERVRIALPEVTIGLFPDAGATWFLRNLPGAWAAWLALTGSHMNQADAVAVGLGQYPVPQDQRANVQEALCGAVWIGDASEDRRRLDALLQPFVRAPDPLQSALVQQRARLEAALLPLPGTAAAALERLAGLVEVDEALARGVAAARHGSPTTIGLVLGQLRRAPELDLADCFRLELVLAVHCARNREFAEGVRALLIDKDNAPRWRYPDAVTLPADWVQSHFALPWPVHPLADL